MSRGADDSAAHQKNKDHQKLTEGECCFELAARYAGVEGGADHWGD